MGSEVPAVQVAVKMKALVTHRDGDAHVWVLRGDDHKTKDYRKKVSAPPDFVVVGTDLPEGGAMVTIEPEDVELMISDETLRSWRELLGPRERLNPPRREDGIKERINE